MSAYLDTSVLIPTLLAEPSTEAVFDWLSANRELLVSDFAAAEVAAALSRLVRMGRLASADAFARLMDFDAWRAAMSSPVEIRSADAPLAYIFARRFELALCRAPRDVQTPRCDPDHARSPLGSCRPRARNTGRDADRKLSGACASGPGLRVST